MRTFTLSIASGKRQVAFNAIYETQVTIKSLEDLNQAVQWDNTAGIFKGDRRNNDNFISTDCLFMDCDNEHSESPSEWLTPDIIAKRLSDVEFAIVYSRNHMKDKKSKSARPRFHVYFPLSENIDKGKRIRELKELLLVLVPEFDSAAKDAARFFYGVENPQTEIHEGSLCVDEFLTIAGVELPDKDSQTNTNGNNTSSSETDTVFTDDSIDDSIPVGERHATLLKIAFDALTRYSESKAREIFDKACARCKPQKPIEETSRIWKYALEHVRAIKEKQKKILTLRIVEEALKELNISVQFDVIRKELRVSDLPDNSGHVSPSYYSLDAHSRSKLNAKILPLFLTSNFKSLNFGVSENFLNEAISTIADSHPYNPVLKMLDTTTWDNQNRIDDLFSVLGILDDIGYGNNMYRIFLKKWLHQAIALALNDDGSIGAEFVLILQGKQGLGKTNFFRALAVQADLFKEGCVIDTTNKDSLMENTKIWIAEIGELDATLKKEQAALKSFLTAHSDMYRKPYARTAERVERRTCFAGTVNPEAVIRDSTGSRRYAIIHVDSIDKVFIYKVMTPQWAVQLWRQVYETLYLPNPKGFYLTDEEREFAEMINERFTIEIEGESELRDSLRWTDDNLPIEEYSNGWTWKTLSALKDSVPSLKEERTKSPKLGLAIMRIIRSFGLEPEDFKRRIHGRTEYRLPAARPRYEMI